VPRRDARHHVGMGGLLALVVAAVIGYLVGRWWIVAVLPPLYAAPIVIWSIVENFDDPCTRADGCGIGPVLFVSLFALGYAALVAGLTAAGVAVRRNSARTSAG
jgi:hypothetical protein